MKPILKSILIFVSGAAAGGGSCFIFCKKFYEKREVEDLKNAKDAWIEEEAQRNYDELNKAYDDISKPLPNNKLNNDSDSSNSIKKEEGIQAVDKHMHSTSPSASISHSNGHEGGIDDYTKYFTKDDVIDAIQAQEAEKQHPTDDDENDLGTPFIITPRQLEDTPPGWDEHSATYYIDIGELIDDETDEPVDILNTVTQSVLDQGAEVIKHGDGSPYIFIKCPQIHALYTITYKEEFENEFEDDG